MVETASKSKTNGAVSTPKNGSDRSYREKQILEQVRNEVRGRIEGLEELSDRCELIRMAVRHDMHERTLERRQETSGSDMDARDLVDPADSDPVAKTLRNLGEEVFKWEQDAKEAGGVLRGSDPDTRSAHTTLKLMYFDAQTARHLVLTLAEAQKDKYVSRCVVAEEEERLAGRGDGCINPSELQFFLDHEPIPQSLKQLGVDLYDVENWAEEQADRLEEIAYNK